MKFTDITLDTDYVVLDEDEDRMVQGCVFGHESETVLTMQLEGRGGLQSVHIKNVLRPWLGGRVGTDRICGA